MKKWIVTAVLALFVCLAVLPPTAQARDELKNTDPQKYYILLDLKNQIVTVFEKDDEGEYTKVVRRMICTTGRTELDPLDPEDKGTPTPKGIYKIGSRERFGKFAAFGATYARYWTQIVGGVYFHSIMFSRRDIDTLQSSAYRNLGNNVSHGCVRLYVEDAKWLYYNAPPGTTINVSTKEPSNRALKRKLKYSMSFKDYNAFQKKIYDEEELPNKKAWVVVKGAQIRTGNGSNDHAIYRLDKGTKMEVLQEADPYNAWTKVQYKNREGYIKTAYVTLEKGKVFSKKDADILRSTAYLYEKPDEKADIIGKVPRDTSVKVLEAGEDWTKIQYYYEVGYVKNRYLTKGWGTIHE